MRYGKKYGKKILVGVLVMAMFLTSVPISNLGTLASELSMTRPQYSKKYYDMFENVTSDRVIMTLGQSGYRDRGAWSTTTKGETNVLESLTYNTAQGTQNVEFAQVDAQFGYDFKGEVTDYVNNVMRKSLGEVLGSTWHVLQKYSHILTELQGEDTFVYETDIKIDSINEEGFYFNFRVPDLQGEGNYWMTMRTGLRVTSKGFYLYMMGNEEIAKYEYDVADKGEEVLHLTILSAPDNVSVWMGEEKIFDQVIFQLSASKVTGLTYQWDANTTFSLNDAKRMVPNIGMYVQGASKFTLSNQHLYNYGDAHSDWDVSERNYFDGDAATTYGNITMGKNKVVARVQNGSAQVSQDLSADFVKEDTVITELEYTPTNINYNPENPWMNIVELDVAFRSDGSAEGTLKMKLRVAHNQTLLYFCDNHMETKTLADTTNLLDGQKVRLTIVHDSEKASVYFNGLPLYHDMVYSSISNSNGNTVDFANMKPVFQINMAYADWTFENISVRKTGDIKGLAGVTPFGSENNLMTQYGDIVSNFQELENWETWSDTTVIDGDSIYTDLRFTNLAANSNNTCANYYMCEKFSLFGEGNKNMPLETNDSFVMSAVVRVSNEQLSDGTHTYPTRLANYVGSYDSGTAWFYIDKGANDSAFLHALYQDEYVATVNLSEKVDYQVKNEIRLTTAVSPFGYDVYIDGQHIYHFTAPENAVVDYQNLCYEAGGAEVRISDIVVYKNVANSNLYYDKVKAHASDLQYYLRGIYHEKQSEYQKIATRMAGALHDYDGENYDGLKGYLNHGKLVNTLLSEGKPVNHLLLDGSASVERNQSFEPTLGGDGWKYGGITLFENGCTMKAGETWIFEANVTCTEKLSDTTRIGFGLNRYQNDDYADVMMQNGDYYYCYWNTDHKDWQHMEHCGDSIAKGDSWKIQYIVKPFESIQFIFTNEEGTTKETGKVAWEKLHLASLKTEESIFYPYFMFTNLKVELSDIYIGYENQQDAVALLETTLSFYESKDLTCYTEESKSAYEEAKAYAKEVLNSCKATQREELLPYSRKEIEAAAYTLKACAEEMKAFTLEFKVGGRNTHTTEAICETPADEALPTNVMIDGSKYLIRWKLDGKVVDKYDPARDVTDYEAEFVDTKMLEVKYQEGTEINSKRNMRYITSVNSLNYRELGFVFSMKNDTPTADGANCVVRTTKTVYTSVLADGKETTVAGAGYDEYSNYMYTRVIRNVPVGNTIYVRAFVTLPDTGIKVYGPVRAITGEAESELTAKKQEVIIDVFHDQGADYLTPLEPVAGEELTLRLRTERSNVTNAYMMYNTGTETNVADVTGRSLLLKNMEGTGQKYGYISLFNNSCPFGKEDIWVIETDITVSNYDSGSGTARVGLKLYDLKLYLKNYLMTTFINNSAPHYVKSDGNYQQVSASSNIVLSSGGTWHFKYTIINGKTLRTEVTDKSGTLVLDYTVNLSDTGYTGSQKFLPKLYVSAADYELTNIRVYEHASTQMKLEKSSDYYDTWKCNVTVPNQEMKYWFIVENNTDTNMAYCNLSHTSKVIAENSSAGNAFGDYFRIIPGQTTPDWAKGALWYSLMPDAFYNGNTTNDKQISGDNSYTTWNKMHKDLGDRYGGDLQGVEEKLDYVGDLSVDAIYMNPIFKSYQNAGYGSVRYDEIESAFGNEANLISLSNAVHDRDMKLTSDVVLGFTHNNSYYYNLDERWPEAGAYQHPESKWSGFFVFEDEEQTQATQTQWGGPLLNLANSTTKAELYGSEDSALLRYAKWLDGYRFDCGGVLWGRDDNGQEVDRGELVSNIRKALRSVHSEFYLLAEADEQNMDNNSWDSQWNLSYNAKLADYARGELSASDLGKAMYSMEMRYPRTTALCFQNSLCTHDTERVNQSLNYMYNPAVLVQMTYLGSPVIYYGEEIGLHRKDEGNINYFSQVDTTSETYTASFYSMEWDESNWNQDRLRFYKALGELRSKYSCVRTGVVKVLSNGTDANQSIIFGRWDTEGAAVTIACRNVQNIQMDIDVKHFDIQDGTVMTDWFTGATYVVKDGKITADVIPGGTVIVTGEQTSTYGRQREDTEAVPVHGAFSVEAELTGNGQFFVGNGSKEEDLYYGVQVKNGTMSIQARLQKGGTIKVLADNIPVSAAVTLTRNAHNVFSVSVAGNQVPQSVISIGMNHKVFYGFAEDEISAMSVSNVSVSETGTAVYCDDFTGAVTTTLLDGTDAGFVSVQKDTLALTNAGNGQKVLLTNGMDNDWSFKAKMDKASLEENSYSGVICRQDGENYVAAGQMMKNGKRVLFIGQATDGTLQIFESVEEQTEVIIVQLQRIGAYYSAVYSTDEGVTWHKIGTLFANYSHERVGIVAGGEGRTLFDWVSFGNYIQDGMSTNTPYTPEDVEVTYTNDTTANEAVYRYAGGEWSITAEGWTQSQKTDTYAQLQATNKTYENLYVEATIRFVEAKSQGVAGFAFGMENLTSGVESGYRLSLSKDGTLVFTSGNTELAKEEVSLETDGTIRLVLRAEDGWIRVYAGQKETLCISLKNIGYQKGYTSLFTKGAAVEFRNFYHGSTGATWNWVSGRGSGGGNGICTIDASYIVGDVLREIPTVASYVGTGFTDFVLSSSVIVRKTDDSRTAKAGFLLGSSEGVADETGGVYIYLDGNGTLKISVRGEEKASYNLGSIEGKVNLMIVKRAKVYYVYVNGSSEPALSYEAETSNGGVLTVYTKNCAGIFSGIQIAHLNANETEGSSSIWTNWENRLVSTDSWQDDFSSPRALDEYLRYNTNQAKFVVQEGNLQCTESNDWHGGITVTNNVYENFEMEFDMAMISSTGWAGIGVRKASANGDHNTSGMTFLIDASGGVQLYQSSLNGYGGQKTVVERTVISDFNSAGTRFKIRVSGNVYSLYVGNTEIFSYTDNEAGFGAGFISFSSGNQTFWVDNLKIQKSK